MVRLKFPLGLGVPAPDDAPASGGPAVPGRIISSITGPRLPLYRLHFPALSGNLGSGSLSLVADALILFLRRPTAIADVAAPPQAAAAAS